MYSQRIHGYDMSSVRCQMSIFWLIVKSIKLSHFFLFKQWFQMLDSNRFWTLAGISHLTSMLQPRCGNYCAKIERQ